MLFCYSGYRNSAKHVTKIAPPEVSVVEELKTSTQRSISAKRNAIKHTQGEAGRSRGGREVIGGGCGIVVRVPKGSVEGGAWGGRQGGGRQGGGGSKGGGGGGGGGWRWSGGEGVRD